MDAAIFPPTRGPIHCGQLVIVPAPDGYELRHWQDMHRSADELDFHDDPEDAAHIALSDDAGAYRPLNGAPNLRRGWRLVAADERALRLALDLLYPARLGAWRAG